MRAHSAVQSRGGGTHSSSKGGVRDEGTASSSTPKDVRGAFPWGWWLKTPITSSPSRTDPLQLLRPGGGFRLGGEEFVPERWVLPVQQHVGRHGRPVHDEREQKRVTTL